MKKILFLVLTSCLLLTSCIDGDDPKPFFYGFATVEKTLLGGITFKSDQNEAGVSDTYNALNDVDPKDNLNNGDRVYMSCTIEKDYGNGKYDVNVNSCSLNLAKSLSMNPTAPVGVEEVFIILNQSYLSTDAIGRKFLNMSVNYSTKTDNSDSFVLGYYDEDNADQESAKIVLRLKHYQKEKIEISPNVNDLLAFSLPSFPIKVDESAAGDITLEIKYTDNDGSEKSMELAYKF